MQAGTLLLRNLSYYWRTNLAVVAGVAVTVAVLAGALLVGDSVRGSLRDLVLRRLGSTAYVISGDGYFREALAAAIRNDTDFARNFHDAVPLIALTGLATHEPSRQRASGVLVYGVDERFWSFHGLDAKAYRLDAREAWLSEALAREFGSAAGDSLLVRVEKLSAVPVDSLHGHKDEIGRTIRLRLRGTLPASAMGEFSVRPQQGPVRAVFVPLARLQADLEREGRVNGILVSGAEASAELQTPRLAELVRRNFKLEDLGVRMLRSGRSTVVLEADQILLNDRTANAARRVATRLNLRAVPVLTYLANTIRVGSRELPYSLVAALDSEIVTAAARPTPPADASSNGEGFGPPIWLNAWAQEDLKARAGERVTLEYYLWDDRGVLRSESADFTFRGTVPTEVAGLDRTLAPSYPGITDAERVGEWNPPFPIDLHRIRARDEKYWDLYRTTPKAYVPLETGQKLWASRYGGLTSMRFIARTETSPDELRESLERELRAVLDPTQSGITLFAARAEGIQASQGAVDFGEYFFYFSFFLVISAVLLTGLFFKLGVEQRLREIGLLEALGFDRRRITLLFLQEGLMLAAAGSVLGLAGAVGYGAGMMYGLKTWWAGAVGTAYLELHLAPLTLLYGLLGGAVTGLFTIVWALWSVRQASPRSLLTGSREATKAGRTRPRRARLIALAAAIAGAFLLLSAVAGQLSQVTGFFVAGALWLVALLSFEWSWLARPQPMVLAGAGGRGLVRLGFRNAAWWPGRSLLCITLMASATFVLVAVDVFRRDDSVARYGPRSGTGGYPLLAESLLPVPYDLRVHENRVKLPFTQEQLDLLADTEILSFLLRPGDDTSCLNLYQPQNPRILGVPKELTESGRFAFQDSLARMSAEADNPWLLLRGSARGGAVPAIADANSLTYILKMKLGDEFTVSSATGEIVHLQIVAALRDSIFQSELLISDDNFRRLFTGEPSAAGYRFFLLDTPTEKTNEAAGALEDALADFGFDVTSTTERLANYHRVENTYLSTFQFLGGLGLLLGTLGLAAVMLRNVLERRHELALLRAVGYRPRHLVLTVLAENALLLLGGLVAGALAAALAIAPALAERGGSPSAASLGVLLGAVVLTGLAASVVALAAVVRAPVLESLRAE